MSEVPANYPWINRTYGKAMKAHERLGKELLASTIGFSAVSAALSWAREIIEPKS